MVEQDLARYTRALERSIADVLRGEHLGARFLPGWQTPTLLVFPFRLFAATTANVRRASGLGDAITHALGMPARLGQAPGLITVEVPALERASVYAAHLHGRGDRIPLGYGTAWQGGRLVQVNVDFGAPDSAHAFIIGPTGLGKTVAARTLVYGIARQNPDPEGTRILILSRAVEPWRAFRMLPHVWQIITDPDESERAILWGQGEMVRRAAAGERLPALYFVVDDLHNLIRLRPAISAALADMAGFARQTGIHLVAITQRTAETDMMISANLGLRLVFRAVDAAEAARNAGRRETHAERLAGYGDALLISGDGIERVAVATVRTADLLALAGPVRDWPTPWATVAPTAATVPTVRMVSVPDPVHRQAHAQNDPAEPKTIAPAVPVSVPQDVPPADPVVKEYIYARYLALRSLKAVERELYGQEGGIKFYWVRDCVNELQGQRGPVAAKGV